MVFGNETEAEAFAECNGLDKDASIEDIARAIASLPYHKDTKRTVIITQVRILAAYAPFRLNSAKFQKFNFEPNLAFFERQLHN